MTYVSLPSDLVIEIMSRVPCKSLARFQSVSKQFRSLFSDPCFLRLRHQQRRSRDALFTLMIAKDKITYNFFVTNKANAFVHKFNADFRNRRIKRMLSSQHQLLCFVCENRIHLCDAVNKELKNLPVSSCNFNKSDECVVSFGFVDATMQYKVVRWPHDLDENRTRRLPSGLITTWKKIKVQFQVLNIDVVGYGCVKVSPWRCKQTLCPYLLQLSSQVHVNGFIYWTTSDFQIVSFSLQDETFSTVNPKPPCFCLDTQGLTSGKPRIFKLSGSRGNLWMIDYHVSSRIMEIWKMEESRSGWAKIHKIDLGGTYPNYYYDGIVEMVDIWSDQVLFKLSYMRVLIYYHANTNTLENYGTECSRDSDQFNICHFTDGLLYTTLIHMFPHNPPLTTYIVIVISISIYTIFLQRETHKIIIKAQNQFKLVIYSYREAWKH